MYTMILDGEYPSDIRVRKEAESLSLSGLEIQVVTRWKRGQKREEKINGVKVFRLGRNYSFRRKGLNDVLSSILFFDFLFYFQLKSFSRTNELGSIVHVHDLPLLRTIRYLFPKKYLILDMHENVIEWAKAQGCECLMMTGRFGWKKPLEKHGWKTLHSSYVKEFE